MQPAASYSLLGPNTLLSTCAQTPSICAPPLVWETKFHAPTKKGKIMILYILKQNFGVETGRQKTLHRMAAYITRI
jgi:hypothetical protein